MTERLNENINNGFIFDGFPRNILQAEKLNEIIEEMNISIDYVFHIDVNENILIDRIMKRASEEIVSRKDDNSKVLVERLKVYNLTTKPVLDFYAKKQLIIIDGMGTIEEVSRKF